jgi:hypothetical protein
MNIEPQPKRRETLRQRSARAAALFDRWSKLGSAYVLLEPSGRARTASAGQLRNLLRLLTQHPDWTLLELADPAARSQFIAWAIAPRGKAN